MADDIVSGAEDRGVGMLTPEARAIAGIALAVSGLMGQNAVFIAIQFLLVGPNGLSGDGLYAALLAGSAGVPALLALALAWGPAQEPGSHWSTSLARAAVVVALLVLVAALATAIGGLVHQDV